MALGKTLSLVIAGTRGIPARYGGFETFAEELSTRLAARGYDVTVLSRRPLFSRSVAVRDFWGVKVKTLPTIMHKYLETPLHGLFTCIGLAFSRARPDVVLMCNAANSPFIWLLRLRGIQVAVNVDGIERRRSKWSLLGRLWYRLGEWCSVRFAHRVVADAKVIADYYLDRFGVKTEKIAYGAGGDPVQPTPLLDELGLEARRYLLYVSRLEPENNALGVIQAYRNVRTDMPLVIVGDAPYAVEYKKLLRNTADERVVFAGFRFGDQYRVLRANCYLYVQATEVGGTHPALVEGLVYGNCIVANATPEHFEVVGGAGEYYHFNDFIHLSEHLQRLVDQPEHVVALRLVARSRGKERFSWDRIVEQYEELFRSMVGSGPRVA